MKILIVDDSHTVRTRFKIFLQENGYKIYEADNGFFAFQVLKDNEEIKIIVSDLNMPEMNFISVLES